MTRPEPLRLLEEALTQSINPLTAQRKFLLQLILAILAQKTICQSWLALWLDPMNLPESNRTRIRRFLENHQLRNAHFALLIARFLPDKPWILTIDRTNWNWGKASINFLVLAVVFQGNAVPLFWIVLDREGNSHTEHRIQILQQFVQIFGAQKIQYLTGDREFIGKDWFKFLHEQRISFRIRIRKDDIVLDQENRQWEACQLFRRTNRCKRQIFWLWEVPVYLGGKPLQGEEWLFVASNEPGDLLLDYRQRWKIECLFQSLKGRGFNLEATRIVDSRRLGNLLGVLALVHVLCLRAGEEVKQQICRSTNRLRKSVARCGMEVLRICAWMSYARKEEPKTWIQTRIIAGRT
jgi:hypothetical protein